MSDIADFCIPLDAPDFDLEIRNDERHIIAAQLKAAAVEGLAPANITDADRISFNALLAAAEIIEKNRLVQGTAAAENTQLARPLQ